MPDKNPIYKIELGEGHFPEFVEVNETGIKTVYKFTGYGYVQGHRAFIEYEMHDVTIRPQLKKD